MNITTSPAIQAEIISVPAIHQMTVAPAIHRLASVIIACQNHPSLDSSPSPDDVAFTRAMVQAGKLLDIQLLDHLIISSRSFVSLKERGLGAL